MLEKYKTVYEGGEGEIVEKKSRFIATVRPVQTEEEALAFIEEMKKKYWDARHNCYVYSVGKNREYTRCSDDGEPSGTAGRPMLDVILGEDIYNVAAVVTRYFGGILLGTGGLVRAYSRSLQEGLAASTVIEKTYGISMEVVTDYTGIGKYKASILANGSKVLAERVNFAPQPQSSMSVIDQHTGYVKALIGGRGEKTASLTLNRATDTTRQPGSTFKIVSTYAPALNEKGMTLATTFEDEPYEYPDGSPVNNATRSYNGTTTIRTAIQNSINVVAVKCLEKVTPELGLKYLDNFGFTTLAHGTEADKDANGNVWSDANLATALGGITRGVTNVELCASYAAIANNGNYIKPIYYTKILDHNGNVLIENTAAERSVIKESTAFLLTSAMEDVVKQGTGTACQLDNMPVAGKTGTTEAYNDLWFVGYTPYYTCAVWSGYDNNEKLPDYARNFHKALWKKVMTRIHEGLPSKEFEKPASVEKLSVCEETGLLPRAGCPVITEYFDVGTMPTEYCDQHFYDSDDYDYNYDTDSSDQTDNTTDTDNSENSDNGDTDNSGDSNNTDDNGNSGDDGTDNTGGSDDNGDGNEDDSSYQVDYY